MAIVNLDSAKIKVYPNKIATDGLTASNTDGFEYTAARPDDRTVVIVYNSDDDTAYDLTIKAPANKLYAGAVADQVVEIAYGEIAIIQVETAKYMDASTGKITFDSENAALLVAVAEFIN